MTASALATLTAHIRNRIKVSGIKARVRCGQSCGSDVITVVVPTFDARFSSAEIKQICLIANVMRLTFVRGSAIDMNHEALLNGKIQWDFYVPADVLAYWAEKVAA